VETLRRAAEAAPKVLPGSLGEAAMLWLRAEAACHETVQNTGETVAELLATIGKELAEEPRFTVTVSTLGTAVGFAREVLALAEQQRAAPESDPTAPEGHDIYVHIGHGDVATTREASEFVYVDLDSGGNPIGVEILGAIGINVDGKRVLPAMEPSGEVVTAMARAICNRASTFDLWASDLTPESRQGFLDDARAALMVLPREVLDWLTAQPEALLAPVELTPEQSEELKARFEALRNRMPEVLYHITRANLSYLLMDAYGLGMDDEEAGVKARGPEDLHRAMARGDEKSAQILSGVGIPVRSGTDG
jgi:hypothetical protein